MLDVAAALLSVFAPQEPPAAAPPVATVAIEGRVVDLRGEGVPVARVAVAMGREPDVVLAKAVCDGDGYFRVGRVAASEWWRVTASKDGMCTGVVFVSSPPTPVRVELHDAAIVRGVLHDKAGKAVAAAVVRAEPFGRSLRSVSSEATTDGDGAFTLSAVPLGITRITALVPGEGVADARVLVQGDTSVALAPGDGPTTRLAIEVSGLTAEERAKVKASILPYGDGRLSMLPPPWNKPVFDSEGRCELTPAPDLEYRVSLGLSGFAFEPNERVVKSGTGPHRLVFAAKAIGGSALRWPGILRDADGKPVEGVRLVMRKDNGGVRTEAVTAADGSFEFESRLGAGTQVIVYATGPRWVLDQDKKTGMQGSHDRRYLTQHECVVDPTKPLALRAAPACSVRGRLLLADGRPAAFVEVRLEEESANRQTFAYATTDRDGNYAFAGRHWLLEGVRVLVEGVAGAAVSEAFALDEPGKAVVVPELTLSMPGMVEGLVLDAGQHPAPGVRVWLRDWDMARGSQRSGSVVEVITDRQGRYRFVGVPPGGAYLQVLIDDPFPQDRATAPFEVEAGKTYTFELAAPAK